MNKQTRRLSTDELTNGLIRTKDFKRYLSGHADSMQVITLQKYL